MNAGEFVDSLPDKYHVFRHSGTAHSQSLRVLKAVSTDRRLDKQRSNDVYLINSIDRGYNLWL
jgi:hypothetical protein